MATLSKKERQKILLAIISNEEISTQEELAAKLRKRNLKVTQATISRDIKDLNITKTNTDSNKQKYIVFSNNPDKEEGKLINVFYQALVSYESAGNLVVVKTLPGMASASASALDSLEIDEISGTLAGDDTVFIATKSAVLAHRLTERIKALLKNFSGEE